MKSDDKNHLLNELNGTPRTTEYEVEMYLDTDDGLELFDTLNTDEPPLLPDAGEQISFEWIEDDDGNEVFDPVSPDEIGSDRPYSVLTSRELEVDRIKTKYGKRNYDTEDGTEQRAIIHKTVILTLPHD